MYGQAGVGAVRRASGLPTSADCEPGSGASVITGLAHYRAVGSLDSLVGCVKRRARCPGGMRVSNSFTDCGNWMKRYRQES